MLTSLMNEENTVRRPSGIAMPRVIMCGSLGSSPASTLGGKLEQEATNFIDSRRIRQ